MMYTKLRFFNICNNPNFVFIHIGITIIYDFQKASYIGILTYFSKTKICIDCADLMKIMHFYYYYVVKSVGISST